MFIFYLFKSCLRTFFIAFFKRERGMDGVGGRGEGEGERDIDVREKHGLIAFSYLPHRALKLKPGVVP